MRFEGVKRTVIDGPFMETRDLIAGFWLWQVKSMDNAVQWLKKAPFGGGAEVEIRQVFEPEDFGPAIQSRMSRRASEKSGAVTRRCSMTPGLSWPGLEERSRSRARLAESGAVASGSGHGDHSGLSDGVVVRRFRRLPDTSVTYTAWKPSRSEMNASWSPSGDQL